MAKKKTEEVATEPTKEYRSLADFTREQLKEDPTISLATFMNNASLVANLSANEQTIQNTYYRIKRELNPDEVKRRGNQGYGKPLSRTTAQIAADHAASPVTLNDVRELKEIDAKPEELERAYELLSEASKRFGSVERLMKVIKEWNELRDA